MPPGRCLPCLPARPPRWPDAGGCRPIPRLPRLVTRAGETDVPDDGGGGEAKQGRGGGCGYGGVQAGAGNWWDCKRMARLAGLVRVESGH
jgi:hypothetical protein